MIPPPDELITRDALNRIEQNSASNLGGVEKRLEQMVQAEVSLLRGELVKESALRELTERLGGEALKKASDFITEKTEEHNNLLSEMRLDRVTFVTKDDLEKEKATQHKTILFYISIAGFVILIVQNVIRYMTPEHRDVTTPVTISQPSSAPVPVKTVP